MRDFTDKRVGAYDPVTNAAVLNPISLERTPRRARRHSGAQTCGPSRYRDQNPLPEGPAEGTKRPTQ